jgi:hypothetical protein
VGLRRRVKTGLYQGLQPGLDAVIQLVDLARPAVDDLISAGMPGVFELCGEFVCLGHFDSLS